MKLFAAIAAVILFFISTSPALAAENVDVANFASQSFNVLIVLASLASVLFLIKGGYSYITSSGKPDAIENAKLTIRNAFLGLVIVLGAAIISSILNNAFTVPSTSFTSAQLELSPIVAAEPSGGLTGTLRRHWRISAKYYSKRNQTLNGRSYQFFDNDTIPCYQFGNIQFLASCSWHNRLTLLVIALLGFQLMSASTFGFEEVDIKHLLPRIALAFLGANTSIFLFDWVISIGNVLTQAVLASTGGINNAWVLNAFDPAALATGTTAIITLIFMILFVVLAVVLLLFYITRLITISLIAVLSPLIFLLWLIPKFSDFAEISIKTYIVVVFSVFVHVVIIQLASAFLTVPGQSGTNSLISILVGVGILFTLLKTPPMLMQMVFYNTGQGIIRKVGGQIVNVISTDRGAVSTTTATPAAKTPRKVIRA